MHSKYFAKAAMQIYMLIIFTTIQIRFRNILNNFLWSYKRVRFLPYFLHLFGIEIKEAIHFIFAGNISCEELNEFFNNYTQRCVNLAGVFVNLRRLIG